jgi:hypothetical protein
MLDGSKYTIAFVLPVLRCSPIHLKRSTMANCQTLLHSYWISSSQMAPIVSIKCCLMSNTTYRVNMLHKSIPLLNNTTNNNIENDRRYNVSLLNSMSCMEWFTIKPTR